MTPALAAEISALLLVGMCGGDKLAECEHCQRRLRAVEQVRALVRDECDGFCGCCYSECRDGVIEHDFECARVETDGDSIRCERCAEQPEAPR